MNLRTRSHDRQQGRKNPVSPEHLHPKIDDGGGRRWNRSPHEREPRRVKKVDNSFDRYSQVSRAFETDSSEAESDAETVLNDEDEDDIISGGNVSAHSGQRSGLYPDIKDSLADLDSNSGSFNKQHDSPLSHVSHNNSNCSQGSPNFCLNDSTYDEIQDQPRQRSPWKERDSYCLNESIEQASESPGFKIKLDVCIYCIFALALVILAYGWYMKRVDESSPVVKTESVRLQDVELFEQKFQELQMKFPNQTQRHWKVVKVALKKLLRVEHSTQPAIIMFASLPHANDFMDCVAKYAAEIFTDVKQARAPVSVHGKDLASQGGAAAKLALDEKLSDAFQNGRRVAILQEIDLLGTQPLLLLHSFCDHENAPFKNVALLFTLKINADVDEKSLNDEFIDEYLGRIWEGKLGVDEMGALRSRIANNKVISQAETDDIMKKHCSK